MAGSVKREAGGRQLWVAVRASKPLDPHHRPPPARNPAPRNGWHGGESPFDRASIPKRSLEGRRDPAVTIWIVVRIERAALTVDLFTDKMNLDNGCPVSRYV